MAKQGKVGDPRRKVQSDRDIVAGPAVHKTASIPRPRPVAAPNVPDFRGSSARPPGKLGGFHNNVGMDITAIEQVKELPRRSECVWQGGLIGLPKGAVPEPLDQLLAAVPVWVEPQTGRLHLAIPEPGDVDGLASDPGLLAEATADALIDFVLDSAEGGYRPGRVEVDNEEVAEALGFLEEVGVELRIVDRLESFDEVFQSLLQMAQEFSADRAVPGALKGQGVTVARMRSFADAAAAFYRAAPWQYLTDIDLVAIERPEAPRGMEYAAVLGAGGTAHGLGFSGAQADHFRMMREEDRDEVLAKGLWQVTFDRDQETPPPDVALWKKHDLALASPDAYPAVLCFSDVDGPKRPSAKRLAFVEGVLRALAETSEAEIDSGRWQKEVETHDGPVTYTLAIPDLLNPPTFPEWHQRGFEADRRATERLHADIDRYFEKHPPADMEEMQATLNRVFTGKRFDELTTQPETPLEKAQELCYQAFETHGRRRVQLAREAIAICPDCADARTILAEQAGTPEAEFRYYTEGVAAGERALGPAAFEETVGHFWGVSSTRPYMRARFGLAACLEKAGRFEDAVVHYRELLRLNPNDNQGARYALLPLLIRLGRDAEAEALLKQYNEEASALWAYARALLVFRSRGKSPVARQALREALGVNPHVPKLLDYPGTLPELPHYEPGEVSEAVVCVHELRPAYAETPGALDWVAADVQEREKKRTARQKQQRRKQRGKKNRKKGR